MVSTVFRMFLLSASSQRFNWTLFLSPETTLAFLQLAVLHIYIGISHEVRDLKFTVLCRGYGVVNHVPWYLSSTHNKLGAIILCYDGV